MTWHQGQRQQKFVFDQLASVQKPTNCQYVVFALCIQFSRCGFAVDKPKTPFGGDVLTNRLQTPLTRQRDGGVGLQMQPNLLGARTRGAAFASKLPLNYRSAIICAVRVSAFLQAREL